MRGAVWALAVFLTATLARGEPRVALTVRDGLVWLSARDATAGQILAEWARVGATRIINIERLENAPMTIQLAGVPEETALNVVLRSARGFTALRRRSGSSAPSQFDVIWILATGADTSSTANTQPVPAAASPTNAPIEIAPGIFRLVGPDGRLIPDDQ